MSSSKIPKVIDLVPLLSECMELRAVKVHCAVPGLIHYSQRQYVYLCTFGHIDNNLVFCTKAFVCSFADISILQHIIHCCHSIRYLHKDNALIYNNACLYNVYLFLYTIYSTYCTAYLFFLFMSYWYYYCHIFSQTAARKLEAHNSIKCLKCWSMTISLYWN